MKDAQRSSWDLVPISSFAKTGAGGTPKKSNKSFYEGGRVPWLLSGEVGRKDITKAQNLISAAGLKGSSAKLFPPNSVLVAMYGATAGEVGILRFEASTNQAVCAVLPSEKHVPEYLYYYLLHAKADLISQAVGNAQPNISQAKIKALPIPLPPLEEQRRIVAVLDEAFEGLARARAHAEANLQNAQELFESIKTDELTYAEAGRDEVKLSDVADITSGLVDPREETYSNMLHLGAGNMITGTDKLVDVKTAREEKLKSGKYLFDEKTVLYSKIRPYLRKAARPDFSGLCSADVYPLTPKPEVLDRDFLFHLLLGNDFTEYAVSGSDRAGMPKVNRNHLFAYRFEIPPLEAQRRVAKRIDEAHRSCSALASLAHEKLQDIDDLRQSLLQKAFAGELT